MTDLPPLPTEDDNTPDADNDASLVEVVEGEEQADIDSGEDKDHAYPVDTHRYLL